MSDQGSAYDEYRGQEPLRPATRMECGHLTPVTTDPESVMAYAIRHGQRCPQWPEAGNGQELEEDWDRRKQLHPPYEGDEFDVSGQGGYCHHFCPCATYCEPGCPFNCTSRLEYTGLRETPRLDETLRREPDWEKGTVPWPLRLVFGALDSALEVISCMGYKPDWYQDEYERKGTRL